MVLAFRRKSLERLSCFLLAWPRDDVKTTGYRDLSLDIEVTFFFTLVTGPRRSLSLKLGDTRVYESQIRAHRGRCVRAMRKQLETFYLRILVYLVIYDSG